MELKKAPASSGNGMSAATIRNAINAHGVGLIDEASALHGLLLSLIGRHPDAEDKIGVGVDAFEIQRNPRGPGLCAVVIRFDGTAEIFSWQKCIGKVRDRQVIDGAYRRAVAGQIADFRKANRVPHDWHVDHIGPYSFAMLVDAYEAEFGSVCVADLGEPEDGIGRILPEAIAEHFAEYHERMAVLRATPAADNLSRAYSQRRAR